MGSGWGRDGRWVPLWGSDEDGGYMPTGRTRQRSVWAMVERLDALFR
jgi:hypothetical protein